MLRSKYGGSKLSDACPTIALRTYQLEPSPINACCAESSRLVDANLGRQRQSWEGQKGFGRVRTAAKDRATRGGAPATQHQTPFRPLESIHQPISLSSQICTKAERVHQKQQRETLGEAGCARTGVGVGGRSPVQQPVAECDQPSRLAWQRSDVLECLRCPCANAGQINVEAEMLRKRWNGNWAAEEGKGGRTEDFGEGVAACRHSPPLFTPRPNLSHPWACKNHRRGVLPLSPSL